MSAYDTDWTVTMPKRTRTDEPGVYKVERSSQGKKTPRYSYEVAYRNGDGKPRSKTFRNFNAARDFKRSSHTEVKAGTHIDSADGKVTLSEYYRGFRERQIWEPGTYRNFDVSVRDCTFTDVPLAKLRASHVEQWVKVMSETLEPSTVRTYFRCVKSVISSAVKDQHLHSNPLEAVKLPRMGSREMHIPTPEVVGEVLEASYPHFRALWAVCAFAGLRAGEAAGLKVGDVHFLKRQLKVERQVQRGQTASEFRIVGPKYDSYRTIYAPDALLEILSEHIRTGTNGDWLFMGSGGNPPMYHNVFHWWKKTLRAAGVDDFKLHDLRHFYASGLIAAGATVPTVQRQLGHKSASVTLNTYSHLWPDAEEVSRAAAAGLMHQVFGDDVGIKLGLGET